MLELSRNQKLFPIFIVIILYKNIISRIQMQLDGFLVNKISNEEIKSSMTFLNDF